MSKQHKSLGRKAILAAGVMGWAIGAQSARADEGGASVYLLGSGAPGSAVMPPLPGVYLDNTIYIYDGSASARRDFVIGGNVVADIDAAVAADFVTMLWVPSTNFLGGTLAIGGTMPIGGPMLDARAVLTTPQGREVGAKRHDSILVVGDPVATAQLGWKSGKFHAAISGLVNIPVGRYDAGDLANLAFHRWAYDISAGMSLHDEESGWDVSTKAGITFNGKNDITDYDSGNDFHAELGIEKTLSKAVSVGALGYYFEQVTGDSGPGATLGPFKGRVAAAGGTVAYNMMMGRSPATWRIRVLKEFSSRNRLEGTTGMISLTLPLSMKMPPH